MPLIGDILGISSRVIGNVSDYISGNKNVDINNIAADSGALIGDVLNRTGATDNIKANSGGSTSNQVGQALGSAAASLNNQTGLFSSILGGALMSFVKKNMLIIILIIGGILYLIFRKK